MLDASCDDSADFREIDFVRSITLRAVEWMEILIHLLQVISIRHQYGINNAGVNVTSA